MAIDEDAVKAFMQQKQAKDAQRQAARLPVTEDADRLFPLDYPDNLPAEWASTPVGDLVRYHNLGETSSRDYAGRPAVVIWRLFEFRPRWRLPAGFAFELTAGSEAYRGDDFPLFYSLGTSEGRAVAVVAHSNSSLHFMEGRRGDVVSQLQNLGMSRGEGEKAFDEQLPRHRVTSPVGWALAEAQRLSARLPQATIVPLLYAIESDRLYGLRPS